MEISSILSEDVVTAKLKSEGKEEVLKELLDLLVKAGKIKESDEDKIMASLIEREELGSTGIGQNVGIPHTKTKCVDDLVAAFGLSNQGVDFDALDGNKVKIIFLLLAPEGITGPHLKALARISRILRDRLIRERLLSCEDSKSVISVLAKQDKKTA